jgi:hypothetical protein
MEIALSVFTAGHQALFDRQMLAMYADGRQSSVEAV